MAGAERKHRQGLWSSSGWTRPLFRQLEPRQEAGASSAHASVCFCWRSEHARWSTPSSLRPSAVVPPRMERRRMAFSTRGPAWAKWAIGALGALGSLLAAAPCGAQQPTFHLDRLEVPGSPDDGVVLFRPA